MGKGWENMIVFSLLSLERECNKEDILNVGMYQEKGHNEKLLAPSKQSLFFFFFKINFNNSARYMKWKQCFPHLRVILIR